jgi:nucleotide-binding universal stress UspA family protein
MEFACPPRENCPQPQADNSYQNQKRLELVGFMRKDISRCEWQDAGGSASYLRPLAVELTALWVRQPLPRHADLPGEAKGENEAASDYFEEQKKEVVETAQRHGMEIGCVTRAGHAAKVVVSFAREGGYDLIVIGHSDHSELWGRMLGDTADRIADHAHCSVLIIKH